MRRRGSGDSASNPFALERMATTTTDDAARAIAEDAVAVLPSPLVCWSLRRSPSHTPSWVNGSASEAGVHHGPARRTFRLAISAQAPVGSSSR